MTPTGKVVKIPRSGSRTYVTKAREFADAASVLLDRGHNDAALLIAIHAGISAADAAAVALAGLRSADPDHQRAADLLESAARGSEDVRTRSRQLRSLLQKKNLVEYESRRSTSAEARDAVQRADRLVAWAEQTVRGAKY